MEGNEIMKESEAEVAFKEAVQEFEVATDTGEKERVLEEASDAAEDIEDDEKKSEAFATIERLRSTL